MKADLCDRREWVDYLELFDENAEFHIPQWDSEHVYTSTLAMHAVDVLREPRRPRRPRVPAGDRKVGRLDTHAAHPAPDLQRDDPGGLDSQLEAKAKWVTHVHRFGQSSYFYGDSTYLLRPTGASWVILKKHVVLMNDTIDSVLDFYHV